MSWVSWTSPPAFSTEAEYYQGLLQFLQSQMGAVYRPYIKLTGVDSGQVSIAVNNYRFKRLQFLIILFYW